MQTTYKVLIRTNLSKTARYFCARQSTAQMADHKSSQIDTLSEWVQSYADALYQMALAKTGKKSLAEDLVQDTFVAALENFSKFKGQSQPKTWLFGILKNKIADFYKQQIKLPFIAFSQLEKKNSFFDSNGNWVAEQCQLIHWENQTEWLDDEEFQRVLTHCMEKLPTLWEAILRLRYLEQQKGKDISVALGISQENYWQIIHRAKLRIRDCLNQLWFNKK